MRLFTNSMEEDTSLGVFERTAYGLGNFANAFMFIAIAAFLTFYYTDVIGLSAGVIGTIMLVSRIFDGITDLAMGYIIDHSKPTKFGKARKLLLRSCIPYALSGVLVFMVPQNASDMLKYIFVFISYNVCNAVFYTAVTVSYNMLMVKMTRSPMERGLLGIFLMVLSTCGGLVVTSTCLNLVHVFGGGANAWTLTILVYAVIGLFAHVICIFGTKERINDELLAEAGQEVQKTEKLGFVESFRYLVKNKYWLLFVLAFSIYWIAFTMTSAGNIYYAQYIMHDQGYQPVMANVIQIVTLVGMLIAFLPMRALGKAKSARLGAAVALASFVVQVFAGASYHMILVCCGLRGFGWGLYCAVMGGMNPDALDYGEWKFGKDVSGMGVAAVSFGQKIGTGLGSALFGIILSMGGYDGTAEVLSASAIRSIQIDYTWIPLVLSVISLVLMMRYDLDGKLPEVQAELKKRRAAV